MLLRLPKESRVKTNINNCVICDGFKHPRFWACKKCAVSYKLYGKPYKRWPQWVKELIKLRRKENYRESVMEELSTPPDMLVNLIDKYANFNSGDGFFIRIGSVNRNRGSNYNTGI